MPKKSKAAKVPPINQAGQCLETHQMFEFHLLVHPKGEKPQEATHINFDEAVGPAMLRMHKQVQKVLSPADYHVTSVLRCLRRWDSIRGVGYDVIDRIPIEDWEHANPSNPDISTLPKAPTKRSDQSLSMFNEAEVKKESERALDARETTGISIIPA
jgi:hypothetical protein